MHDGVHYTRIQGVSKVTPDFIQLKSQWIFFYDMTPPDFFLCGVLKHDAYSKNPLTIPELKDIIRQKCLRIDIEIREKACQNVIARMRKCIQVEGEVFEHYE